MRSHHVLALAVVALTTTACVADEDSQWPGEETEKSESALSLTFQAFATHPSIAAQPETGRRIADIAVQGNNLILGYGDWNSNTGPIDVAAIASATAGLTFARLHCMTRSAGTGSGLVHCTGS